MASTDPTAGAEQLPLVSTSLRGLPVGELLDLPVPPPPLRYLARMARFSDGVEHEARRAGVFEVLPSPDGLEAAAYRRMAAALTERLDIMPLLSTIPVVVLGEKLGCGDVSPEIALLCEEGVVSPTLPDIARCSVLFQCRDATAALAVVGLVEQVALDAAVPVERTRREGVGWDPLSATPDGAGRHACPGRAHALALARGMHAALADYEIVDVGPDLGRPNLRLPSYLVVQHRPA